MTMHEGFIRQCHDLAINAGKRGDQPFGALLVYRGQVLLAAENTVHTDRDSTRHAELNLVVKAGRALAPATVKQCTLYTSTAPCLMCTAAMWNGGVSRLVYSVSYEAMDRLSPAGLRFIPCDQVYRMLQSTLDVAGPILEEEGLRVFEEFRKAR